MKKIMIKAVSLVMSLSLLFGVFAVLPLAEGENTESGLSIIYNRGFEEGWNYTNGLKTDAQRELDANLTYQKFSSTKYDYFLRLAPSGDRGGYLELPIASSVTSGKLFLEFDIKSETADNNIGGIIMTAGVGEDPFLTHIVSFNNGRLILLGSDVGAVPTSWCELSFVIDFDYAVNTLAANPGEYLVTVWSDTGLSASRVYSSSELGFSSIFFGAQENFLGYDRETDAYLLDNIRLYSGVDAKTELPEGKLGSAVDKGLNRDFEIEGMGAGAGYLSGSPDVKRLPVGDENVVIHYNRTFSEGWDYSNGFKNATATLRGNEMLISYDYASEMNNNGAFTNYFLKYVQRNTENGFVNLNAQTVVPHSEGKTYFEFDIKCSVGASIPCLFEVVTPGSPVTYITDLMKIDNGRMIVFGKDLGQLGEEWCHVIVEMDYDWGPANGKEAAIRYTVTVGSDGKSITADRYVNAEGINKSTFRGLSEIRIGRLGSTLFNNGDWYGLDNLQLYSAPKPAELNPNVLGSLVNESFTKDFPITDGFIENPSVAEIVDMSLTMKVNSHNALLFGKKVKLFDDGDGISYGAPYKENGVVMVPLKPLLEYMGAPYRYNSDGLGCDVYVGGEYRSIAAGRDSIRIDGTDYILSAAPTVRTENGKAVFYIGLEDVERIFNGYYVTYDEVGFISISPFDDYVNRDTDEDFMRNVMRSFVYDSIDESTIVDTVLSNTDNLKHPYLYVKQDRFDYMYNCYNGDVGSESYDADLHLYIEDSVKKAQNYYKKYALIDENGNYAGLKRGQYVYSSGGMASWVTDTEGKYDAYYKKYLSSENDHSISVMPYPDNNGYDYAGNRLNIISDGENCLSIAAMGVAFGYQMTRDENWLRFVYDWSVALTSWTHWGPAHYLNVAEPAHYIGLAYDWCYNGWVELGLDPAPIRDGLYRLCTHTAYRSVNNLSAEYKSNSGTESGKYWNHIGNWNPVSSAGVIASCLISLENPEFHSEATYALERTVYYLGYNGFTYFTFDGSYRESAGYWCATIRYALFCIIMLKNSFGTDLGLLDAPGIDISNYFGSHIETADNGRWNYHDDWKGVQPSYWYYLATELFGNKDFAAIRYKHVEQGKDLNMLDAIFYDPDMIPDGDVVLGLDYFMDSIDAAVSRSSWDYGALYAGIMGGINNVAHGQYDSGNWIYENAGIRWFDDLGADDYNLPRAPGFGPGGLSSGYYKYSAQGNNVLCLASIQDTIPHGQVLSSGGEIIYTHSNAYGSATVIDNAGAYGGAQNVTYARRGMLLTNDRKTVVIQDEVASVLVQDFYWYAHFDTNVVPEWELTPDGRTFYMYSKRDNEGNRKTLRVTLVTANRGFKFEVQDTSSEYFVLDATPKEGYAEQASNGVVKEYNRSNFRKLTISGKSTLMFDVAVVIELIDPNSPEEVGYRLGWDGNPRQLPPMLEWMPSADTRAVGDAPAAGTGEDKRPTPQLSILIAGSGSLSSYISKGSYLGADREEFFKTLSDMHFAILRFGRNQTGALLDAINTFDGAKEKYDKYQGKIDKDNKNANSIALGLVGIKTDKTEANPEAEQQ